MSFEGIIAVKSNTYSIVADTIDRQYCIEQIEKARDKGYTFNYDTLIDFIKVLPSVERSK